MTTHLSLAALLSAIVLTALPARADENKVPDVWHPLHVRLTAGLLTYERFHPDPRIVEACRKMADLLIDVYGEGKHDLTKYGTRKGISATTLLESIVMLYERTRDGKYLEFAEHIVAMSENNPGLRLMGVALEKGSLTKPGEGKAYQMMANLLGYLRLHACTHGPWALAGKRGAASPAREPLIGKPVTAGAATEWLEALPVKDGELPTFRIKGTKLVRQPYHSTGSLTDGPQTYFKLLPSKNASSRTRRPNIILFLVDDLGWSDLGCYGSTFHDTPNIDALAGEGVRFTDAYATCHVCSPSRASILTGKYPARLKLTDWLPGRKDHSFQRLKNALIHQALPLDETTLAEALKPHGYRTGHFGKWHLGEAQAGPLKQGFDVQVPQNWFKGWPKAGYHAPFKFDGFAENNGDYLTDRLTDEALRFIDRNRNDPFFLYLPHFAVHDPIQGRGDLVKKYEQRRAKLPPEKKPFILEGNPDAKDPLSRERLDRMISEKEHAGYRVLPQRTVKIKQRQDNPQFAAMVESVDESLGRVVAKLEALDLEDDTIIIFTSDNGGMSAANFGRPDRVVAPEKLDAAYSTSNLPLRGAKGWLYEGGIRVPLIIKWPGKGKAGSTCSEPVIGTDHYPTVLDMLGLPASPGQHPDGRSLAPLFDGKTSLERDAIYWHFPHYSNHGMQSPGGAIRSGRYKLLDYFENGTVQLFDLEADPGEQHDLAKSRPEIANRLLAKLRKWRKDVGAEMMTTTAGTSRPAQRPNILFCISDDQSYEHTGANGDPVVQTPAFDRVAGSGLRFVNAYFMMENRDRPDVKNLAELAFGMRPADELYAIKRDPGQLENLADRPEYEPVLKRMKSQLMGKLETTGDPRVIGGPVIWDHLPYYGSKKNKNWAVETRE